MTALRFAVAIILSVGVCSWVLEAEGGSDSNRCAHWFAAPDFMTIADFRRDNGVGIRKRVPALRPTVWGAAAVQPGDVPRPCAVWKGQSGCVIGQDAIALKRHEPRTGSGAADNAYRVPRLFSLSAADSCRLGCQASTHRTFARFGTRDNGSTISLSGGVSRSLAAT